MRRRHKYCLKAHDTFTEILKIANPDQWHSYRLRTVPYDAQGGVHKVPKLGDR